jgi:hypothetical protein
MCFGSTQARLARVKPDRLTKSSGGNATRGAEREGRARPIGAGRRGVVPFSVLWVGRLTYSGRKCQCALCHSICDEAIGPFIYWKSTNELRFARQSDLAQGGPPPCYGPLARRVPSSRHGSSIRIPYECWVRLPVPCSYRSSFREALVYAIG